MKTMEKETDIQNTICEYLSLKKHFFWRQNTSPTVSKTGDKWVFRRMAKYAMRGIPDIIIIKDGFFIGLEVKKAGGKQSPDQKEFESRVKEAGAEYHVVRSIKDVQELGL